MDSSLCPLVHAGETENMSSNSRESINLDQKEEKSDVPSHLSDYMGTSKKSEQPSKRTIELKKTGEFISQQKNQEGSVENSGYLSLNKENLRNCGIQKNSGMHSEKPRSKNEKLEIRGKEINLKNDNENLIQKGLQSENKLVRSCLRMHEDNLRDVAEQQKNEIVRMLSEDN